MSDPTTPPLKPTTETLAEEVRKIAAILRNAALDKSQWNNLINMGIVRIPIDMSPQKRYYQLIQ